MQWVLWQDGFKNRVEGRELANHLGCIKHYQLYLLSTGFLNHQPQYNCAAYWATKEGGKKHTAMRFLSSKVLLEQEFEVEWSENIWTHMKSVVFYYLVSIVLESCIYQSSFWHFWHHGYKCVWNFFFPRNGHPLFSPTWKLRHLLSLWTLHDALPPFQFSPCKSQKVGSCWGHQSRFQQRYFNFEIWPKVTHLKKQTIFRGYQLSPHFFWTKTRKDRWYFLGVFLPGLPGSSSLLFESPICSICCILQWPHVKTRWTWRVKDVLDES